jgi:hypothetical protein
MEIVWYPTFATWFNVTRETFWVWNSVMSPISNADHFPLLWQGKHFEYEIRLWVRSQMQIIFHYTWNIRKKRLFINARADRKFQFFSSQLRRAESKSDGLGFLESPWCVCFQVFGDQHGGGYVSLFESLAAYSGGISFWYIAIYKECDLRF